MRYVTALWSKFFTKSLHRGGVLVYLFWCPLSIPIPFPLFISIFVQIPTPYRDLFIKYQHLKPFLLPFLSRYLTILGILLIYDIHYQYQSHFLSSMIIWKVPTPCRDCTKQFITATTYQQMSVT